MVTAEQISRAIAGVKEGSGVVGKVSRVACFAFFAMGVGLYSMPGVGWEKMAAMLVGIAIVAGVFVWFVSAVLNYAKENPVHAALESGDVVEMKRLEMASKSEGAVLPTENTEPPAAEKKPE